MKKILIIVLLLVIILISIIYLYNKKNIDKSYDLKIHILNTGKSDAIIISKNNNNIMIDTGYEESFNIIDNYFKENNIKSLDYLILTHFDKDHIGSASKILENYEVKNIIQGNYIKESTYYSNYINSLKKILPITISDNYELNIDDLNITINAPSKEYEENESNNSSLIVSINYNNNNFLFMGDAQNDRIKDFLKVDDKNYDFIKMPYHGNYMKSLDKLIKNKNIKYAVITSSNTELEDDKTIDLLKDNKVKYYLTRKGSVSIYSNSNNIIIKQ